MYPKKQRFSITGPEFCLFAAPHLKHFIPRHIRGKMALRLWMWKAIILLSLLCFASVVFGEPLENHSKDARQSQASKSTYGQVKEGETQEDLGYFGMSFEELMNIKVEVDVASLFIEDELLVGSTVSSISPAQWRKLGARRVSDVLANELSVAVYPRLGGNNVIAIRGYA